jgi:carboxymethylenebutenolidase
LIGYRMGPIVASAAQLNRVVLALVRWWLWHSIRSPHLLIPQMKAQFLIAVAENDDMREPETKTVLKDAFAAAKLSAEIEVYAAAHGWCPPDTQVYSKEQSEKAWARMLVLFEKALA